MLRHLLKFLRNTLLGVTSVVLIIWVYIAQPTFRSSAPLDLPVDETRLKAIVKKLSIDFHPRNFNSIENLDASADFIETHFRQAGGRVVTQPFVVNGRNYRNVRCFFGPEDAPRLIIGAHYDSNSQTPGADDNASGIAGLIELAYLLGTYNPTASIELVAFTLEEPPFFGSKQMGSYYHAETIYNEGTPVRGMIALEMIGYFSDAYGSQDYPMPLFNLIYPNTGNFIAVIGKLDQRDYISAIKVGMKGSSELPVYSVAAPVQIPGIDFSDHRNYWEFGINAVMITDTAFYRNKEYHKSGDTADRLDYGKMADVVRAVYSTAID